MSAKANGRGQQKLKAKPTEAEGGSQSMLKLKANQSSRSAKANGKGHQKLKAKRTEAEGRVNLSLS